MRETIIFSIFAMAALLFGIYLAWRAPSVMGTIVPKSATRTAGVILILCALIMVGAQLYISIFES